MHLLSMFLLLLSKLNMEFFVIHKSDSISNSTFYHKVFSSKLKNRVLYEYRIGVTQKCGKYKFINLLKKKSIVFYPGGVA